MKISRIIAALAVGVLVLAPAAAAAESSELVDTISVDSVVVNRLGGVSLTGSVSCPKTAAQIRAGTYVAQDANEDWVTIPALTEGDYLIVLTNPDVYTVSQPVGRRLMVRVTHESSRAMPCYLDPGSATLPDGYVVSAETDGVYTWKTDLYGYDPAAGPLFDYSPDGKFVSGRLSVNGHSEGAWIMVRHAGEWLSYNNPEGLFLPYVGVMKATMTR